MDMQQSITQCVMNITKTYFREGSIIGVASAGFKTITNNDLGVNTNNIIVKNMMHAMHWTMLIQKPKSSRHITLVSITSNTSVSINNANRIYYSVWYHRKSAQLHFVHKDEEGMWFHIGYAAKIRFVESTRIFSCLHRLLGTRLVRVCHIHFIAILDRICYQHYCEHRSEWNHFLHKGIGWYFITFAIISFRRLSWWN